MKITVLNGNPQPGTDFDNYLADLKQALESNNHSITEFVLRNMEMSYCIGCFGCWVKTPGECSVKADDSLQVRKEVINSDLVILASPIIMGYPSALLKKIQDKLIPLLLPYVGLFNGELHHLKRYEKYPLTGLLLEPEADTDAEDLAIINEIYARFVLNFHSRIAFSRLTTDSAEEVVHEINSL